MNIPNPIDAGKDIVGSMWRHDVAVVKGAVHVTRSAGKAVDNSLPHVPDRVTDFVTMPMQATALALKIGWWVLGHMRELMLIAIAIVLAIFCYSAFSIGRTAWGEVHSRVRTVVRQPSSVRSGGRSGGRSAQPAVRHSMGSVFNDGVGYTACARGGRAEAKQLFRRAGVKASSNDLVYKGRCPNHPSCSLIESGS